MLVVALLWLADRIWPLPLPMVVIGNIVGFFVHGGLVGMGLLLRGWPNRQADLVRSVYYVSLVATLSVLGIVIGNAVLDGRNPLDYLRHISSFASVVPFALVMSLLMLVLTTLGQQLRGGGDFLALAQHLQLGLGAALAERGQDQHQQGHDQGKRHHRSER